MTFTRTLQNTLKKVFLLSNINNAYAPVDMSKQAVNSLFLLVNIKDDTAEIPLCYRALFEDTFTDNIYKPIEEKIGRMVFSLFCYESPVTVRTSEALIKQLFWPDASNRGLRAAKFASSNVYYGTRGLILNNDFEPLLLMTVKESVSPESFEMGDVTLRISPRLLAEDSAFSKFILTKVIPYYTIGNCYSSSHSSRNIQVDHVNVRIENFDDMFYKPALPQVDFDITKVLDTIKANSSNVY